MFNLVKYLFSEFRRFSRKCRKSLQRTLGNLRIPTITGNFGNLKSNFRTLELELLQIWNASAGRGGTSWPCIRRSTRVLDSVERFGRRGTEPFEPFEAFEAFEFF